MTASGGNFIGSEVKRNKQSPQCGVAPIELAEPRKMSDQELCRAVYMKMYRAMIDKDIPALSEVLDASFVLVHMTGMRQHKAAFLKAVADGTLNYASADHDSMDVAINGDHATLIGKSRVHAAVFGGGWHTWRLEQDLRLVKINGTWRITLSEASTY